MAKGCSETDREDHMATGNETTLPDVAILTRAVESVFRKLIRMLVGRISLKKLQEMIQSIFVEEAEAKLQQERPGKNVPLSTLAVLTGFDTRTLTRIKSRGGYMKPFHQEDRFLSQITPECSVLDVWESSQKYRDPATGKPMVLPLKGSAVSFETLIRDSIPTRGVTSGAFLHRLQASKSVVVDKATNEVWMIDKRYTPFDSADQTENTRIGMAAVGNLVETITHNLNAPALGQESFYQQGCWTNRLERADSETLRKVAKTFLDHTDEQARAVLKPFEQDEVSNDQVTAGISMFYFEEEQPG